MSDLVKLEEIVEIKIIEKDLLAVWRKIKLSLTKIENKEFKYSLSSFLKELDDIIDVLGYYRYKNCDCDGYCEGCCEDE